MTPLPIVACGFVSSGTRLLYRIIHDDFGMFDIHRSYPHWEDLWDWRDFPEGTKFVAIHRRPDVAIPAARAAKHPGVRENVLRDPPADDMELMDWYKRFMEMMSDQPDVYWVDYEKLVAEPLKVTGQLAEHLAYKGDYVYRQIRDENAKWLTANDT